MAEPVSPRPGHDSGHARGEDRDGVLFVLPQKAYGGLHRLVEELTPGLEAAGFPVTALVPDAVRDGGQLDPAVTVVSSPRLRTLPNPVGHPVRAGQVLAERRRVARSLAAASGLRPAIVHVFGFLDVTGPELAPAYGARLVRSVNSSIIPARAAAYARHALARSSANLFEGRELQRLYAPRRHPVPARLFYPAARPELVHVDRAAGRARRVDHDLDPDRLLVATWSNITPQKGLDQFIRCAEAAARRTPSAQFAIIGRSVPGHEALLAGLRAQVDAVPGLRSRFRFIVDQGLSAPDALALIDVFALTSRFEGVATATVEALTAAVPVVAHTVGSVGDLVQADRTGWPVRPGDVDGFARAVATIASHPARAVELAAAGQELVLRTCSRAALVDAFVGSYRTAAGRQGVPT